MRIGWLPNSILLKRTWGSSSHPIPLYKTNFKFFFFPLALRKIEQLPNFPLPKKKTWELGGHPILLFLNKHENWGPSDSLFKWIGKLGDHWIVPFLKNHENWVVAQFSFTKNISKFFFLSSEENRVVTKLSSSWTNLKMGQLPNSLL